MKNILYKYRTFIGIFLVFSVITLYLFYQALKPVKTLPIYNPADVNPELVDSRVQYVSKYHTIGDFSLRQKMSSILLVSIEILSRSRGSMSSKIKATIILFFFIFSEKMKLFL